MPALRTTGLRNLTRTLGGQPATPLNPIQQRYRHGVLKKLEASEYHLEVVAQCLCGSEEAVEIANQDRFGLPVGVVACTQCGLARTSPRLAAADLPAFYEQDYHGLHMGVPEPDSSMALFRKGQGRRVYEHMKDVLSSPHVRVAEVGCGTGQVLREFALAAQADSRTVDVVGCEYASAYVAAGRAAGSMIEQGSAELLVRHGPFDVVILSHVVEHFADPMKELEIVSQLVAENGHAYVEVPGVLAIHRKPEYDYEFLRYLTVAHTYHFSLATLTDVLSQAGFEPIVGNEEVRMVVRHRQGAAGIRKPPDPHRLLSYLHWLEASRVMQAKRLGLRGGRWARSALSTLLRRVVGGGAYDALR